MSFADNLASLQTRIAAACQCAGRPPASVRLLAVSKTMPVERLREAIVAGQRAFGENYVQEALEKIAALGGEGLEWHHIGLIQSNKTAEIAAHFDWAHGVDRLKIAQRLSDQRPAGRAPLQVCVQVNISGEASKSGCAPTEALALCRSVAALPGLRLRGLMALPAPAAASTDPRAPFRQLRALFEQARSSGLALDTLSMGMSDDFEAAIAEGATLIRVGSALFGARAGKPAPQA
ncbi:YggS family pyridoxal phosphate-dependent enzyme [Stagnimonas aquatica]|uniref:Pyridoxal phosphate homeostasis protein n=1 Tax=Stagnimonas aquatica TaxID=2689987 RepID=A0A3N0V7T9_9GAMM|nr:YggS family pyridoxal phosphate-dependent enzyme [Stagnimonas aquatica]ROH88803.1 YggS family pyridoxal phosphate-dependent enzyme [Stagnimonas aquatica]